MTTNTGTETPAEGTANVPPAGEQPAPSAPKADGEGAEALPTGSEAQEASGTDGEQAPASEEGEKSSDDEVALVGAPETYESFTLPEGMEMDPELAGPFQEVAKAANLSQAGAQQMVDMASKLVEKTLSGFQTQHVERVEQWAVQAKADPLVGGREFDKNVQVAQAAVAKFGDPDLKQFFDEFGFGNHPAFLRFAYRVGMADSEAGFVAGQGSESPAPPVNREQQLAQRIALEQARGR